MYIMRKLLSTASPERSLEAENRATSVENTVTRFPISAIRLEKTNTGKRPSLSAIAPKNCVPITEPTKNIDWPMVDSHADSQTQFSYENPKSQKHTKYGSKYPLHCSCSGSRSPSCRSTDGSVRRSRTHSSSAMAASHFLGTLNTTDPDKKNKPRGSRESFCSPTPLRST